MRDHNGDQVDPRDHLYDHEVAEDAATQRQRPRRMAPPPPPRDPHDDLGYIGGVWDPYYDLEAGR